MQINASSFRFNDFFGVCLSNPWTNLLGTSNLTLLRFAKFDTPGLASTMHEERYDSVRIWVKFFMQYYPMQRYRSYGDFTVEKWSSTEPDVKFLEGN